MTADPQDDLMDALASELGAMKAESAERLCSIMKGLFSCIQDLNHRVATLEGQCGGSPGADN